MTNVLIGLAISAGIISLIFWWKGWKMRRARGAKEKLPEQRRTALAALLPVVSGLAADARLTGTWQGLAMEAGHDESRPGLPRWRITVTNPRGGVDWRLAEVHVFGYMLQTGNRIGVELPLSETAGKLMEGTPSKEDIERSTNQFVAFRHAYQPEFQRGAALVSGLGPLQTALTGDTASTAGFGLGGEISYDAKSGNLSFETMTYSFQVGIPTPRQFAEQLKMMSALRDAAHHSLA